jgi:hypothetical protein
MTRRRVFLALAAALFAGWMIYLLQLALTHWRPVVVSRPQVLVAEVIVIGAVADPVDSSVVVEEVLFTAEGYQGPTLEPGQAITVKNLAECVGITPGSRTYIFPLKSGGKAGFQVVSIPRSPGYDRRPPQPPRIYVDEAESRHQVEHILKP